MLPFSEDAQTQETADSLLALQSAAPWLPVCLLVPVSVQHLVEPLIISMASPAPPVALTGWTLADALASRAVIAIRNRSSPEPLALARWISARLDQPAIEVLIAAAMTPHSHDEYEAADRRLRRALAHIGPFTCHQWSRLAMLARLRRPASSVEVLAWNAGMDIDYLRRWVAQLLGIRLTEYQHLPGWEPVIELALRRVGREGTIHQATTSIADQARGQSLPISG